MTLQEFAALKPGDQIDNLMSRSRGMISETSDKGVHVRWNPGSIVTFHYTVTGTAWMHWSKVDEETASTS